MTEIHSPLQVVKNLDKELQPFKTLMINSNILVAMELAKIDKTFLLIDLPNKLYTVHDFEIMFLFRLNHI